MRRDNRVAGRFTLSVSSLTGDTWSRGVNCFPTQDTAFFLRLHRALWVALWRHRRPGLIISLGVNLTNVEMLSARQGDLFAPLGPAERSRGEQVCLTVDQINARFGDGAIRFGLHTPN